MSKTINEAIQSFLSDVEVGKQLNTVRTYSAALNRFQKFLTIKYLLSGFTEADRPGVDHVVEFCKSLEQMAPATIKNYLAAVSEFYRYLFANRLVNIEIADYERLFTTLRQMRPPHSSLPHVPPDDVIDTLIREAGAETETQSRKRSPKDKERDRLARLRNVALLSSLRSSGMRIGEALSLRCGDLDFRNQSARVVGKGRKGRTIYLDNPSWQAIQQYLEARQAGQHGRALAHFPVFARHDRRAGFQVLPLTRQRVEQIFIELSDLAKIEPRPTPNWFRHWFATRVFEQTQDLAAVQDLLGHESPVTTRIYAKVSTKRLREVHRRVFDSHKDQDDKTE